jgi:5'-nucleotidase
VGAAGEEQDAGDGTDFYAISNGYVSVTPLQLDLTWYERLDTLKNWLPKVVAL